MQKAYELTGSPILRKIFIAVLDRQVADRPASFLLEIHRDYELCCYIEGFDRWSIID